MTFDDPDDSDGSDGFLTFDDFLSAARQQYGVTLYRLRTATGVNRVFLIRPGKGEQDALCCPRPDLKLDERIPGETIARVCNALNMRPSDFGLFLG